MVAAGAVAKKWLREQFGTDRTPAAIGSRRKKLRLVHTRRFWTTGQLAALRRDEEIVFKVTDRGRGIAPEALERHGPRLWMTIPLVVFGALRYVYQVHRGQAEDFARDLLRDRWIVLSALGWLLVFASPRA